MKYPSPADPADAPVWDNYVVAQTTQASLGIIPTHAFAVGVEINGEDIVLRVQLSEITDDDVADIGDIVSTLEMLLGPGVRIKGSSEVVHDRLIAPDDGVRWTFLNRVD